MKPGSSQFDIRENTASPRQHAPRLSVRTASNAPRTDNHTPQTRRHSVQSDLSAPGSQDALHAASQHAATVGESKREDHLLTVREVATLLQVPVSWVYGRIRKRSFGQIPSYRLGKYWRFRQEEVLAWVESQRQGSHAA
jgi:excisionase family DNA binding protein